MAKLAFTKLGLKPNNDIVNIEFNEQTVEVKQYLSTEEKLNLITEIIENSHDQNNFSNPLKVQVYAAIGLTEAYTNINFTEKQKENPAKLYDLLNGNGLLNKIVENIPQDEYNSFSTGLYNTIDSIYTYQNSVLGILESVTQDYNNVQMDVDEIKKQLANTENMGLLKDIVTKLG